MYEVFDVTTWEVSRFVVSGSKEKEWRICPDTKRFGLLKFPVSVLADDWEEGQGYTGEAWSEKIASEIGKMIDVPTHDVEIAYYKQTHSSLCWRFLDPDVENLEEGADLINPFDPTYDRNSLIGQKVKYNLELLYQVFESNEILPHLFDMIVFDALIGNTDRHQDNFGIITTNETKRFAPLYDNASCLGRELKLDGIHEKMSNPHSFENYIKRCTSLIRLGNSKKRTKHFQLLEAVLDSYKESARQSFQKVESLDNNKIDKILHAVPTQVMHEDTKSFVNKVLTTRRDIILGMR
ncbi:HipA domain-containing protein [Tumebacillus avium]|nr:HipA domain-containing protein [Tumebacillus avium]